ncbi:MAG: TlpA family protein disulfide reductase [Gammaproteobacteria bacterium]
MHRRPLLSLLAGFLACLGTPAALGLDRGAVAPPLLLRGDAGNVAVPAPGARLTWVDFWASWCGPCRKSFPWMNEMQARYGAAGFRVVAVNLDAEAEDATRFLKEVPADFLIAYDTAGDSARRYGVMGMPTSVLLDAEGKVLLHHAGFDRDDAPALEAAIREALGTESAR